jgi:hypothetical protein
VTDPFDDTATGLASFVAAVEEVRALLTTLRDVEKVQDKWGPLSVNDTPPMVIRTTAMQTDAAMFVSGQHAGLTGGVNAPVGDVRLSGANTEHGKMQATLGADLASLPKIMSVLGAAGPTLGQGPTSLARAGQANSNDFGFVRDAPAIGREVARRITEEDALGVAIAGPSPPLAGLLSAFAMATLSLGVTHHADDENNLMKYRFVLMPRTSHAVMFQSLSQAATMQGHGAALAGLLVQAINKPAITTQTALLRNVANAQALTVGEWIAGVVDQHEDRLLPAVLDAFLGGPHDDEARTELLEKLESFGTIAGGDMRGDGKLLMAFEHRAIDPIANRDTTLDEFRDRGRAILQFMIAVRAGDDEPAWPLDAG